MNITYWLVRVGAAWKVVADRDAVTFWRRLVALVTGVRGPYPSAADAVRKLARR